MQTVAQDGIGMLMVSVFKQAAFFEPMLCKLYFISFIHVTDSKFSRFSSAVSRLTMMPALWQSLQVNDGLLAGSGFGKTGAR